MAKQFSVHRDFMEVSGELYEVIRSINESSNKIPIDLWKEHLQADKVFRKDGRFYFVKQIEDAKIVTEEEQIASEMTTEIANEKEDSINGGL
jgi:hypothetical protein